MIKETVRINSSAAVNPFRRFVTVTLTIFARREISSLATLCQRTALERKKHTVHLYNFILVCELRCTKLVGRNVQMI